LVHIGIHESIRVWPLWNPLNLFVLSWLIAPAIKRTAVRLYHGRMQIQAYQFVKYDQRTSIEHIESFFNSGAVICFDFEDGIQNPLDRELSDLMKDEARHQFTRLYSLIQNSFDSARIGIRLNNLHTADFEKDLIKISGKSIDSIFLPKVESPDEIETIIHELRRYKVEYKHLIPIIETKKGLSHLEYILEAKQKPDLIAFGHCDYNLDIGAYPFFHQDSFEYWKWISVFSSKTQSHGIQIINSPYLNTDNDEFFNSMLNHLATLGNQFSGQVTLTSRQSEICNTFKFTKKDFKGQLQHKNKISVDKGFALDLFEEFETNNKSKGLTKSNNRFISLQEYMASKKLINDNRCIHEMCFIGGCFPVQHNIVYEDLFHQKLKRKIENNYKIRLNVNIIRYERLNTVLEKVKTLACSKKLDLIVFHVRPEPYLRLLKLFYRYIDDEGKSKWSLNLPSLNLLNPEKFDMLDSHRIVHSFVKHRNSFFYNLLISCNYLLGKMIGNERYALKCYYATTRKVIDFCEKNDIRYIILGPNHRSNNSLEPSLCNALDSYFSKRIDTPDYISGFEKNNTHTMIRENGIHVTQEYHDLIAERLHNAIADKKILNPTTSYLQEMQGQTMSSNLEYAHQS
jgi:citrate lyase beta subunit